MNPWDVQSCRACLLQDSVSAMYDLAVPDTLKLFEECSNTRVTYLDASGNLPQHLCTMCYRMCELMQGFRERCQDTERKLNRVARTTVKTKPKRPLAINVAIKQPPDEMTEGGLESSTVEVEEKIPVGEQFEEFEHYDENYATEEDTYEVPEKKKRHPPHSKASSSIKRNRTNASELSHLQFVPGPNDRGVWQFCMRDTDNIYAKCMVEDCGAILVYKSSTGTLRNHLRGIHGIDVDRAHPRKE